MAVNETFSQDLQRQSLVWATKWLLFLIAIGVGWHLKKLTAACALAMGTFLFWQGVLPYRRFSSALAEDIEKCGQEKEVLQSIPRQSVDGLLQVHGPDMASLLRTVKGLLLQGDKRRRADALQYLLGVARRRWEGLLEPVESAAGIAPIVGLALSLGGMADGLDELGRVGLRNGLAGLLSAMSSMVISTMAGCVSALLLIGLVEIGRSSLNTHLAELELWGSQFLNDPPKEDNLDRLFDTRPEGVSI